MLTFFLTFCLAFCLFFKSHIYSDILSSILSGILSDVPSGMFSGLHAQLLPELSKGCRSMRAKTAVQLGLELAERDCTCCVAEKKRARNGEPGLACVQTFFLTCEPGILALFLECVPVPACPD